MTQPPIRPAPLRLNRPPVREQLSDVWSFVKRRKILVGVVAWGVLVGILAFVSPSVTVREQTTAADVLGQLDQAMGDAAGILAGSDHGYHLSPLTSDGECDITPVRAGEQYNREMTVYAADVDAAVVGLADGLADRYRLELVSPEGLPLRYQGEIPGYVELTLVVRGDAIVWRADTGCRRPGDAVANLRPSFEPPVEVVESLAALGLESTRYRLASAQCGDLAGPRGVVRSVAVTEPRPAEVTDVSPLADSVPEHARVLVSSERVLVYRVADTVTSVAMDEETVTVGTTVDCQ